MMSPLFRSAPVLLSLVACSAPAEVPAPPPHEENVKPGINKRFLESDLDVDHYVDVFEGESREIAVQRHEIFDLLELRDGMSVGDIGAGTGLFLEPMANAVGPEGAVYPVEISTKFVEHLRARAEEMKLPWIEPVLCDERSVCLPPESIDVAFVCDTYHHFEYPESTLASIRAALRPGGRLVIVDFERIPGESNKWLLEHVRLGKEGVIAEIEEAGFALEDEPEVAGLEENYVLRFRRR